MSATDKAHLQRIFGFETSEHKKQQEEYFCQKTTEEEFNRQILTDNHESPKIDDLKIIRPLNL